MILINSRIVTSNTNVDSEIKTKLYRNQKNCIGMQIKRFLFFCFLNEIRENMLY